MKRRNTLPLGIDLGAARTRVALFERERSGAAKLVAVAARATGSDPVQSLAEAVAELGTKERRCIMAIAAPDAQLRTATFPALGRRERVRAARFDAARGLSYPIDAAAVRVVPLDDRTCVVGTVPQALLQSRVTLAKRSGLRTVAVDHAAFAIARAFPYADAIVDLGETATTLIVPDDTIPSLRVLPIGGRTVTNAIADALGIDRATAEQRKRTLGLAGAGEQARDALIEQLAAALVEMRAGGRLDIHAIALTGNGARLAGLAEALERAIAMPVGAAALPPGLACELPPDVVRSASPDWGLACGLALWETAA